MKIFLIFGLSALFVGALIPVQAASNAMLSQSINSVVWSALVLFAVGLLVVGSAVLLFTDVRPSLRMFSDAPWYAYAGGFIVATYVLAITWLAPRMGVGNAICFIVTGQVLAAILIDHFGLMGAKVYSFDLQRLSGIVLMILGLFLAKSVKH